MKTTLKSNSSSNKEYPSVKKHHIIQEEKINIDQSESYEGKSTNVDEKK
jgi:hypothetical protein